MICNKFTYTSELHAIVDAQRIEENSGEYCTQYECDRCSYWHVTSKRPRTEKKKKRRRRGKQHMEPEVARNTKSRELNNRPFAILLKDMKV